ncbi:MAG: hypothetical protein PHO00_07465, partial [bacterium]|nr:hypothetical protein [bacterium]
MSISRIFRRTAKSVFFICIFSVFCLTMSRAEDGGIPAEISFLEKVVYEREPRIIGSIDYNNLTIKDTINRLYEVDRDIAAQKLIIKRTELELDKIKVSAFFPSLTAIAGITAPVDLFYKISNAQGAYLNQRLNITYKFDSDLVDRINSLDKNRETELADMLSTFQERFIELMEAYLRISLSQKEVLVCLESYKEAERQLERMRKDPRYARLDILQAEYYITPFFKETIASYGMFKEAQRNIKILLGLEEYETLVVRVSELPETLEEARNLVLEEHLRLPEYKIGTLTKAYEAAKAEEKVDYRPFLELVASSTGTMEQDTIKDTPAIYRATSALILNVFVTDFGYSESSRKFRKAAADMAGLDIKVENDAIESDNVERNCRVREFSAAVEAITEFISKAEETIALMKERVDLPVEELLKKTEQLLSAKLLLRQLLADYTYEYLRISRDELDKTDSGAEFLNMTFEKVLELAEKNKVAEELALEKGVELQEFKLKMARCYNNPVLKGGMAVENESYTTGDKTNTTKAFMIIESKFFDISQQYMIEEAKVALEAAKNRLQVYRNRKYLELIDNFVKVLQYERQIEFIGKIMELKESIIEDMRENRTGEYPK